MSQIFITTFVFSLNKLYSSHATTNKRSKESFSFKEDKEAPCYKARSTFCEEEIVLLIKTMKKPDPFARGRVFLSVKGTRVLNCDGETSRIPHDDLRPLCRQPYGHHGLLPDNSAATQGGASIIPFALFGVLLRCLSARKFFLDRCLSKGNFVLPSFFAPLPRRFLQRGFGHNFANSKGHNFSISAQLRAV